MFVYFLKRECKQTELLRNLKPPGGSDHTVGNSKTPFIYWMPAVSHYGQLFHTTAFSLQKGGTPAAVSHWGLQIP